MKNIAVCAVCALIFAGCSDVSDKPPAIAIKDMSVQPNHGTVGKGRATTFTASLEPIDANEIVKWGLGDGAEDYIEFANGTVGTSIRVKGKKLTEDAEAPVTLIAVGGGKSVTCSVEVIEMTEIKTSSDISELTIEAGGSYYCTGEIDAAKFKEILRAVPTSGDPIVLDFSECTGAVELLDGGIGSPASCIIPADAVIGDITLPNGINRIVANFALFNATLTSINIPNGVTDIGGSAFIGCEALEEVAFPVSLKSISTEAFAGCTGIETLVIPSSVTTVGADAFADWTEEQTITVPWATGHRPAGWDDDWCSADVTLEYTPKVTSSLEDDDISTGSMHR